jgi:hypothetical protein
MNLRRIFQCCVICAVISGVTPARRSVAFSKLEAIRSLPYTRFAWTPWHGVSSRGGLSIPVVLNGVNYQFQLDTGTYNTVLYGREAEQHAWVSRGGREFSGAKLLVGGTETAAAEIEVMPDMKADTTAGTVGLDLLLDKVSMIDFPHRRFYRLASSAIAGEIASRATWSPLQIKEDKAVLKVMIDGVSLKGIFFDTGSSALPLYTDYAEWRRLTGRNASEATVKYIGDSWGQRVTFVGAPIRCALEIAGLHKTRALAFFRQDKPELFSGASNQVFNGVLGNALFWDQIVILDLTSQSRMGIFKE